MTFNSGHAYTKIQENRGLGQATVWEPGYLWLIDPRFGVLAEPVNSSTTPWVFNVDMRVSKVFYLSFMNLELYARVLNVFNTRNVLDVFPTTGSATDDGWLKSPYSKQYREIPNYEAWYRTVILANRAGYMEVGRVYGGGVTGRAGSDLFSSPREIRIGMKIEL